MDCDDHVDFINQLKAKYPPIIVEEAPEPSLDYDEYGPRLIINKIENENFKSYGGIQTLGPFHKNFTCVIGPNGSGKSNVIDALLFVFGFRASKIRSKKLSVLIHKSELYPNLESCSVRVFFQKIKPLGDGDDEYEVIPNSEFVVVRTAYKDNSSIYKINDKKANNKEVNEFLKKQGIDLDHNRFLILQGEVEQIALMKPKATSEYEDGFLEYLEDIIGSHRFKEPLQILFNRLEELCDLRTEKLNRVKIVGKEKKELEGVRNEAVKYLRLCNEIVIRKNIAFQLKLQELNLLESTAIEKQNEVKLELQQITSDIEKMNNLRTQKENELKEIAQKHLMKMQQFDVSQKKFRDLEIEDVNMRDKRKHAKAKLDELTKMIKLKEKEILKYEKVPGESVSRIEELQNEAEKLEDTKAAELKDQERVKTSLEKETEELVKSKDIKSADLRKQQELMKKQESEILAKKCELELLVGNYEKDKLAYAQLESRSKSIKEKIVESKEKLVKLSVDIPKMTKEYEDINNKLRKLKEEEKVLAAEVYQLLDKLKATRSKEDENKVMSFLYTQQKIGKVEGVVGRLGNLAAVDSKYDVAISTACGRLDNIVTENINNAQRCVELMKLNNISRTTFIGLDKMQSWESKANRPFNVVSNAPRAFDLLVIPNKKYRAALYFALRDLLISNHTQDSVQINRGKIKHRIVTLKGDITEVHGAMIGGGSRGTQGKICTDPTKIQEYRNHSGMDQNIDHRDLEAMVREKEQRLREVRQEINSLTPRLDILKANIANSNDSQINLKNSLKFLCAEENEKVEEIKVAEERLSSKKPDPKQVKSIEATIDKIEQKYQKDSSSARIVSGELDKINEEIMSIGVARMESIKSRIASTAEKIKENSRMLKKINLSVKNAEMILKRTVVEMESLKEDKIKYQKQLEEMDVTLKNIEKQAEATLQEYQSSNQEVNELMKLKEEQTQAQTKIIDDLHNSKQIRDQIKRDHDEKKAKVDETRACIKYTHDEIKKLTLYPLPEGVQEDDDDYSFMDLIGESGDAMGVFSSQKDSHVGTKLKVYSDNELVALKVHKITYQDMEDKLQKQTPNLAAIEEYRMKEELYLQRAAELNEVTQLRDNQRDEFDRLKRQRHHEFTAGFNLITSKLKEMYQMITMGGDADLELADSLDPFSEGILFSVRPPKKSWKYINNLSGGEKTLSSLALVFALHHFKPTPFYVMDEIDAALDFKNVSIVANYLKARTKNAQFIIISLRNNMYELSDRLVGIYKPFNVSKVCVVNPNKLASCLKSSQIHAKPQIQAASQANQNQAENEDANLTLRADAN